MYTNSPTSQSEFISTYFPTPQDAQTLHQLNTGASFIKKRKNKTILKRWKKIWVDGFQELCWRSAKTTKAMKITDIVKITQVKDLKPNRKGETSFVLTFRHNPGRNADQIMELVAPNLEQAQTWITGLNKCRVASRAADFTGKLRPRNMELPKSPSSGSGTPTNKRSFTLTFSKSSPKSAPPPLPKKPHQSLFDGSVPFSQLRQQLKSHDNKLMAKREMATHDSSSDKQLFDFVVVVQLKDTRGKMEPYISYTFPPSTNQKKSNQILLNSIPLFCFPDMDTIRKTKKYKGKTYSFILTDLNGERRHGYCLRMLPQGKEARWPVTYCIISKEGCFQLFSEILSQVERRNAINNVSVFAFLKAVISAPFPAPGQSITVPVMQTDTGMFEKILFERAQAQTGFENVEFDSLFHKLSTQHILSIHLSLLFERRMIFLSNDISLLSSCIHACTSLLYPFEWIQILIPVLPKNLLSYVCSPMPFVVGVLHSHSSELAKLPMEECVIVDLDSDRVQDGENLRRYPALPGKHLQDALRQAKTSRKKICESFFKFSVEILGDYRRFMHVNKGGKTEFAVDDWIASKSSNDRPFFLELRQTQQLLQWIEEYEGIGQDAGDGQGNEKQDGHSSLFDEMVNKWGR
mmetsp:Transcript_5705/g.21561  ORF Transcript_5705/g.21561 Transcript_5705/m.21561 type:complete len:633 (-) Transcript_5705:66-1964(-)|eukprot:CAMPEP_0117446392 /NCGR_PEP_ID=MMETSP0759-20121206/6315_1 /TAXON_ID=63605 /ORGANISM="Percolomonas cosmopolitus, Strain WS" /LENGTH=632 /DNA_ID=CAMNT_0005238653 /DNA_START=347 /DNA_END=2245 /DNA_ORIENTATION=+